MAKESSNGRRRSVQLSGAGDLSGSRQRRGISLEEIADRTKISIRFLRAIEAGEFGELPGGIFATSYLKQYAEAVGADTEVLLADYRAKCEPPSEGRDLRMRNESESKPLLTRFWS